MDFAGIRADADCPQLLLCFSNGVASVISEAGCEAALRHDAKFLDGCLSHRDSLSAHIRGRRRPQTADGSWQEKAHADTINVRREAGRPEPRLQSIAWALSSVG